MIKTKKSYVAALQNRQFSHDPSFYGSIATGLMVVAPLQNASANQPSTHRSIAQFCRDLQVKGDIITNREEIAEFATEFATKTNGAVIVTNFVSTAPLLACNTSFKPITK